MNIKQLIQDEADNRAAQAKVKKEGRDLMALKEPTAEQKARLEAVMTELTALEEKGEEIAANLARARRLQDDERRAGTPTVTFGADHATEKPWGPTVAADASPLTKAEARHLALLMAPGIMI